MYNNVNPGKKINHSAKKSQRKSRPTYDEKLARKYKVYS